MAKEKGELADRRAAAEQRLAEAEARRKARQAEYELDELAKLEREADEQEAIDKAEGEHGKVRVVRHPDGIIIVKRPAFIQARAFHDKGKFDAEAKDKLGRPNVVYPSREAYAELAGGPHGVAVISAVADACADLAGFGRVQLEGK